MNTSSIVTFRDRAVLVEILATMASIAATIRNHVVMLTTAEGSYGRVWIWCTGIESDIVLQ